MENGDKNYRYTELTGEAIIGQENEQIFVIVLDREVNPLKRKLYFGRPIDSDPDANPPEDGSEITRDIKITAGLNKAWYDYHTTEDKFRFRTENGGFAEKWEDLEEPEVKNLETMDPIEPKDPVGNS